MPARAGKTAERNDDDRMPDTRAGAPGADTDGPPGDDPPGPGDGGDGGAGGDHAGGDGAAGGEEDGDGAKAADALVASAGHETAGRLLLAAVEAFAERGFHATTTRDIAGRAGMSPAALYIHYRTKEELLYQISVFGHERAVRILGDAAALPQPATVRLATAVSTFVRWHAEHHTRARVVQYELTALQQDHYTEILALRRRTGEHLRAILEDGVAAGEFTVGDIRGTARAMLSLCIDVARWFDPSGPDSPAELGRLYATLALRMAGADPGTAA